MLRIFFPFFVYVYNGSISFAHIVFMNRPIKKNAPSSSSKDDFARKNQQQKNHQLLKKSLNATEVDYLWQARDTTGKMINGEIRASNQDQAMQALKKRQLTQITLKKLRTVRARRITKKDVAYFTRQLATLLKAGLPLLQSMDIVVQGHENPAFSKLISDIKLNVQSGTSLSQALRAHPSYFDPLYCNLIAAGEQTGVLDDLLERLATYKEKQIALAGKLRGAMIYPSIILLVVFAVITIIMVFVIPTFKEIFSSFGAELPMPTLVIMKISEFFVKFWFLIIGIPLFGVLFYLYMLKRSDNLHHFHDKMLLRLPIVGSIFKRAAIARWSRTLATMFGSGVPIVDSLESVAGSAGSWPYAQGTQYIKNEVIKGSNLTSAMRQTNLFPNMVTQMVGSGEESGSLDKMLNKVSDFYENEVDEKVSNLSTVLEPLIIIVLGVIICVVLVAMYLPLFKLGQAF